MKNTGKLVFALLLMLSVQSMFAQSTPVHKEGELKKGSNEQHQNPADKLKTELNLTTVQYESVKKILLDAKAAREKNEEANKSDETAKSKGQKAIREQTDAKILAILDADQKAKFLALKAEKKEEHKSNMSPADIATKRTNDLTTKLSLDAQQSAKVNEIFKVGLTKIDAIRLKYKGNEDAAKEEIKPIRKEIERSILSVLTEPQKLKYKEYQQEKKD